MAPAHTNLMNTSLTQISQAAEGKYITIRADSLV